MRPRLIFVLLALACLAACSRAASKQPAPTPTAYGTALAEVSGGKQIAGAGTTLEQPVVVQVNDDQGNGVTGAAVSFWGPAGVRFQPQSGLTDSSGQLSTVVSLGSAAGRYQLRATTPTKDGKQVELKLQEIALGYQETLGRQLNEQYCARCHDPESTPERVSNFDNLDPKPHAFTDGETLNKFSDADLTAIIAHGGPGTGRSPSMPRYGDALSKSDIQALIAYIRAISDPPYHTAGVTYARK